MSATRRQAMSVDEFLDWAEAQEERYEFDGEQPVLMTGGDISHNRLIRRLLLSLTSLIEGRPLEVLGPETGVSTIGRRIRYPDALILPAGEPGSTRVLRGVTAVFEVISPTSSSMDRIVKLREYGAVDSIRSYVILETETEAATVFDKRPDGGWSATPVTAEGFVALPSIGIELPLARL